MSVIVQGIFALWMSGWLSQEKPRTPALPEQGTVPTTEAAGSGVEWKEGVPIPVRIPVASPAREFMTTVAFPEESIDMAITGWADGEITAVQKRGLLFLRLFGELFEGFDEALVELPDLFHNLLVVGARSERQAEGGE